MRTEQSTHQADESFTIGRLAAAAGVNVETVRYYQREALMPTPQRVYGSIRRYGAEDLRRLRFIKRAQALGFSLEEIVGLLDLEKKTHCAETRELAMAKLALIEAKMRDLRAMRSALLVMVEQCANGSGADHCPAIETLLHDCQ